MRQAAAERAIADVVDWLARDEREINRLDEFGDLVSYDVLKELDSHARRESEANKELANLRREIPGHFWCSVLADLSRAADSLDGGLATVPEEAKATLLGGDSPPGWGDVQRYVAGFTLDTLWKYANPLVGAWDLENLIRVMRILAVLICPNPGGHAKVARLCMSPLTEDVLTKEAESRLDQGFGTSWEDDSGM